MNYSTYRDDEGKPFVLPSVRAAESKILNSLMNKEYAAIGGEPAYGTLSADLAFGEGNSITSEGNIFNFITSNIVKIFKREWFALDQLSRLPREATLYLQRG